MAAAQGTSAYTTETASSAYKKSQYLALALAVIIIALLHTISAKQKFLTQTISDAQLQYATTQRLAMLTAQHEALQDDGTLMMLKDTAGTAITSYQNLAPRLMSGLQRGATEDKDTLRTHNLDTKMRDLTDKAFSYAASGQGSDAHEEAAAIARLALQDIPNLWSAEVAAFTAAEQKVIDMMTFACYGLCGFIGVLLLFQGSSFFTPAMQQIDRQREHIERMGSTDPLTGIYNRAMFFKVVAMLISGAKRHKHALTVLAVDIDNFKSINDTYGRAAGDAAIKTVAATLNQVLRNSDVMGRVGGEEFCVFLPSTDEYRATFVAEKLRAAIEELPFNVKEAIVLLRVSIGVAEMQMHQKTPDDLLRAAEAALHIAKEGGRNRVATFSGKPVAPPSATPAPQPAAEDGPAAPVAADGTGKA